MCEAKHQKSIQICRVTGRFMPYIKNLETKFQTQVVSQRVSQGEGQMSATTLEHVSATK